MYKKKTIKTKSGMDVTEYHNGRYGAPGMERQKKRKATPEQMEKVNQYNKEKKARLKLMEHFGPNDYFVTLTYKKDERPPDMKAAKKDFSEAMTIIRKEYRKRGYELKWIRNIEVGTKGAWHIHLVINRIPDTDIILKKAWTHGKVVSQLMYEQGGFRKLAAYITKSEKTDPRLKESNYSSSKNLPLPDPEVKIYRRWDTWKSIKVPKGYYIDKESFREGINPITGYPYRTYTLLKLGGSMSRSIIEEKNAKECFFCGRRGTLHDHHIFFGRGKRKKSEHYGLKVHLCYGCHEGQEGIHMNPNGEKDLALKRLAQEEFERHYSHKLFMDEFGKNYLDT